MMHSSDDKGMTFIVKTVTRLTLGFILLYGIYIGLSGHISLGGGFAGGVIIALSFVHIMLAFGKDAALKRFKPYILRATIGIAGLAFLYMATARFAGKKIYHEIAMPLCEMAIVGFGLFAIFVALVLMSKSDKDSE